MTSAKIFSGATLSLYTGAEGATAPTITPATGVITPATGTYTLFGEGRYQDGVQFEQVDERSELIYQGGKGVPEEERRTRQGFNISFNMYDQSLESWALASGNAMTTTAATTTQVGVKHLDIIAPTIVPKVSVVLIFDSPYDDTRTNGWLGMIYLPSATIHLGAFSGALEPEGVPVMVKQMQYGTVDAEVHMVFASTT